ncbi:ROK family transcriptional regulator [Aerococcaceae bacterium 50-4]
MISDKYNIRERNEAMILKAIIDKGKISRANLAKLTKLNKASVSSITKDLIEKNLILENGIGIASSVGGRKPVLLEFNPKNSALISIDVGINYIKGIITYLDGTEIHWYEEENISITKKNVISYINKVIKHLRNNCSLKINGLTVGIHGVVKNNQIKFTPYYDLTEFDLLDQLLNYYSFPIYIENEANLVALGEYCFNLESENLIGISIHSGIGAGIVVDGLLQKGVYGQAGEIGHTILYPNGLKCPCGNNGCFEQYASTLALLKDINKKQSSKIITLQEIIDEYEDGNENVINALHKNTLLLSIGINNIINTLNPETIVINNLIYNKIPQLLQLIKNNIVGKFSKNINIQSGDLQEKSIVMGGIALACQQYLRISKLKFLNSSRS